MQSICKDNSNHEQYKISLLILILKKYQYNIKLIQLNLPPYELKISGTPDKLTVFDVLRKKFVALTPEERVRQYFIHYLIKYKNYPVTLLANEINLNIGNKQLRADSVLYDKQLHPKMIIEYKAPEISITQKVFNQITNYNMLLHVDYLIVSNGISHYCCRMDYIKKTYMFLKEIPDYNNL